MHHFSGVLPKRVLLHQMEISCHIFKLDIFSKFFGDLMSHIIREYAGKEMEYFLNVSPLKIMGILLSLFMVFSLYLAILSNKLMIMPNWRQLHLEIFGLYILILIFFSYLIKLCLQNKWECQWIGTFTATFPCKLNKNVNW